jgi:hypothetical protein
VIIVQTVEDFNSIGKESAFNSHWPTPPEVGFTDLLNGSNDCISGSADCEPLQFSCVHEGQHIANHFRFMYVPKSPKISRPKHTGNTLPPEAMGRRARPAPRLGEQRTYAAAAHAPQDMKAVRASIAHFKQQPALALAGPAHLTISCSAATRRRDVACKNAAAEVGENKCGTTATDLARVMLLLDTSTIAKSVGRRLLFAGSSCAARSHSDFGLRRRHYQRSRQQDFVPGTRVPRSGLPRVFDRTLAYISTSTSMQTPGGRCICTRSCLTRAKHSWSTCRISAAITDTCTATTAGSVHTVTVHYQDKPPHTHHRGEGSA